MASSDDEGETVQNASEYEFICGKDEPISFTELPIDWDGSGADSCRSPEATKKIFLQGKTDNGLRKIYKQVIAWKFDISYEKPEISVLSKEGYWIKLMKPRHVFVVIIRTVLITVQVLHFVKWNPQGTPKSLWDHLTDSFSMLESKPSADDLIDHMSLINETVKRDEMLGKSKLLSTILEEKPSRRSFNEDGISRFIVDDDENEEDGISESEDYESDGEDDCFDSVCAICDNGGDIILCEGKCMRSFHATIKDGEESQCVSLGFTDAEVEALKKVDFYCKNCEHKKHQCFSCGELGSSDESSGAEVFRCGNGACGHFYHPHCVAKLLHPDNEATAKEQQEKIASGEQFACPVHRCLVCKELEVRSDKQLQFAICRRCPRAYHRKCLPRKIAFEKDVDLSRNIVQRAWEGLIPNRILIYCSKHEINLRIATPVRNHIKFPGLTQKLQKKLPLESSQKRPLLKQTGSALEDIVGKRSVAKPQGGVAELYVGSKQCDLSRKRLEKFPTQGPFKKQKVASNRSSVVNLRESTSFESDSSLGGKLYATYFGTDSEPVKPGRAERSTGGHEKSEKFKAGKPIDNALTLDADSKARILSIMKEASSSITLEQIRKRHKAPSTHAYTSKFAAENITLGKVEGSVQAIRGALKKLDMGGRVEDAKAVCGNDLLIQMLKWKEKLKVYLAPFLYGMRYTSFGRHFTKIDKLKEIVDMLHWYIQDGDMLVDFCCGSNDFSCLAKQNLDKMGKKCLFRNYDIHQAKSDFYFERRDWMGVRPNELPEGSRLIMGLNPPFGVNAALANKFVDKALEFQPKLLILIVPRETERLDKKELPYDLIWEDEQMFRGKSFYLPGSVDVNDNQIEDWNVNAPVLYLWSHRDWTSKHKSIALEHGHLSGTVKKISLEERGHENNVSDSKLECHNNDQALISKGEDRNLVKTEIQEPNSKGLPSHHDQPNNSKSTGDNKSNAQERNHSETDSKKLGDKRKRKKSTNISKHPGSHNQSPNVVDGRALDSYSSKHLKQVHVHAGQEDYQQSDRRGSIFPPYSQSVYNGNQDEYLAINTSPYTRTIYNGQHDDFLVRKYSLMAEESYPSMPGMTSSLAYSGSSNPDYDFRASTGIWPGYPRGRTDHSTVNIPGREVQNPWHQRTEYLPHKGPSFSSPYGLLNPSPNPMSSSTMHRYASRLDELNHTPINGMASRQPVADPSVLYQPPVPRRGFQGFPQGPYLP